MNPFAPISAEIKQQILAQLCEQLSDAIYILDANLRYMAVNSAYERLIGYDERFLIGRPLGIYAAEFLSSQERDILQVIKDNLAQKGFYENDFVMITHYGHLLECHITYHKIDIEQTTYHVGMVRDNSQATPDNSHLTPLLNRKHLTKRPNRNVFFIQADKALPYAKYYGGDDGFLYHDAVNDALLNETAVDSLQLETELRGAILHQQFIVYYQPKVLLETHAIIGFEALVRWQHPTRGLLAPHDFMPMLLKHKLTFELFEQVVTQVAKQLFLWRQLGLSQYICINADAAEFNHPNFNQVVNRFFEPSLIYPEQLHIELTESSLMLSHSNVKQRLEALKQLGVCLGLDDFGTGYASLSYLQEYNFDFIKIDRSFICNIMTDSTQQAIVKAILDLAQSLDMPVIAEGIETQEQATMLLKMGCKYAQGYWFGRPMAAERATQMLLKPSESE